MPNLKTTVLALVLVVLTAGALWCTSRAVKLGYTNVLRPLRRLSAMAGARPAAVYPGDIFRALGETAPVPAAG
jgi:hypothetical protein